MHPLLYMVPLFFCLSLRPPAAAEPADQPSAVSQCEHHHDQAKLACNGGSIGSLVEELAGGLKQLCGEFTKDGTASSAANRAWAKDCTEALRTCKLKCQEYAFEYTGAAATLNSHADSCDNLHARLRESHRDGRVNLLAADVERLCAGYETAEEEIAPPEDSKALIVAPKTKAKAAADKLPRINASGSGL